jgi:hypothetical protein
MENSGLLSGFEDAWVGGLRQVEVGSMGISAFSSVSSDKKHPSLRLLPISSEQNTEETETALDSSN